MAHILFLSFSFAAVLVVLDFILDYKEANTSKLTELVPGLGPDPAATAPTSPAYQQDGALHVRLRQASLAPQLKA